MTNEHDTAGVFEAALRAQRGGDYDRAQQLLRAVLAANPRHPDALNNLGLIAYRAHRHAEAVVLIGQALASAPGRAAFHNNLGVVLSVSGRRREAIAPFRRAVAAAPGNAAFRCNLANALKECGEFAPALEAFRAVTAIAPDYGEARFGAALCLLAAGRHAEAWPEHAWRAVAAGLQIPANGGALYEKVRARPAAPLSGELAGRHLLILGEQGLGDQLFFLRFAAALASAGAALSYFTGDSRLARLLARSRVLRGVYLEPREVPPADVSMLAGDLPLASRSGDATPRPFDLAPEPSALEAVRSRLARSGPPPYLGVTWRAGTQPAEGRPEALRKSVPVAALASAVAGWKGTAVVVQRNPDRGELQEFAAASRLALHDASDLNEDLVALHALLSVLDDYAGVSSTSMHLRAAAGRTARVLIAFPPEWRWLAAGPKSPWFPGFSLYREEETPGWEPALARLQRDLADR